MRADDPQNLGVDGTPEMGAYDPQRGSSNPASEGRATAGESPSNAIMASASRLPVENRDSGITPLTTTAELDEAREYIERAAASAEWCRQMVAAQVIRRAFVSAEAYVAMLDAVPRNEADARVRTPDEQRAASEAPVANGESNGTCAQCRTAILITDYVCGRGDREVHYRCWRAAVEAKLSPPGPPPSPRCALCKRDPLACSCKARSRRAAVARLAATPLGPTRSGRRDGSE
jgi:hypothetical protein